MVVVVDNACDSAGMRMLVEYVAVQEAICWQLDPMETGLLLVIVPGAKNALVFV